MRIMTWPVVAILLLGAAAEDVTAQQYPHTRDGFWIGFGLGAGSAGADCSVCTTEREIGLSGYFRVGGTLSPNALIGVETNGWVKSEGGLNQTIGALSGVAYFYPQPAGGLYLKAGAGLMAYKAEDGFDELTSTGIGIQGGIGYEFRLGRNFSLAPYGNILVSFGSDAKFNGIALGEDFNTNIFQFGMGLTWH